VIEKYDFRKVHVERQEMASARLGEFIIGESRIGFASAQWVVIPTASFEYSMNYDPDEHGVLIYGSETGTLSISSIGSSSFVPPVQPGDKVRVRYGSRTVFTGIVDTTKTQRTSTSALPKRFRVDFSATLVGVYAVALSKTVCYGDLPAETAYKRIRRWVKITNLYIADEEPG